MSSNKNLVYILRILLKWWKLILVVTIIAAAGSVAISLLLPNYYRSTVVFYPKNLNIFDSNYLFGEGSKEKVQNIFGDKQDVNRVMSIANSSELINGIINEYKLWEHYGIDTTRAKWRHRITEEFDNNLKIIKTQYDNVELSVWDTDPKLAAEIANNYAGKIGAIYSQVVQERNASNLRSVRQRVDDLEQHISRTTDSIRAMDDTANVAYQTLRRQLGNLLEDHNKWNTLLMQYEAGSNYDFNGLYFIEKAQPAEEKDRPVRWLIVVSSVLAAFVLSILAVLLIEQYRAIKDELTEDD